MHLRLENIGKRYGLSWVFKDVNWEVQAGEKAAIIGHNGSGKSTLLKIISGGLIPTKGKISYTNDSMQLTADELTALLSFAAPYIELIEEMTMLEHLMFHYSFLKPVPGISIEDMVKNVGLKGHEDKLIRHFSSGMKQRLKLAMAIFSDTPLVLLDEPTANLDEAGQTVYLELADKFLENRTVIVSSNQPQEYSFCTRVLDITEY
ncbi:MAG TPA: ABC transporter ATP-binding protein [Chitinophagaceae bacterium]|nr:ABC transporter ATP-binding protein [Chitinophagaceae bacterium]